MRQKTKELEPNVPPNCFREGDQGEVVLHLRFFARETVTVTKAQDSPTIVQAHKTFGLLF